MATPTKSTSSRYDKDGKLIRYPVYVDCSNDPIITEQSHKKEVDINQIIRKHGMDMIQKTAALQQLVFDENPNNDYSEAMRIVARAQESFLRLPSAIRGRFENDPAKFMDFIHNPDNEAEMISLGLAIEKPPVAEPEPVAVTIVTADPEPTA
jgi:phage internal scaffolding protein